MGAKLLMSVEEYLHTSFEDADCDYVDGEVLERNVGELPHSTVQTRFIEMLLEARRRLGIQVHLEICVQINPRRFRVADIAVWRPGDIGTKIPTVPPFLVIEILSSEDRMTRVQPRIQDYLSAGTEWVWLIDPEDQSALCYSQQRPGGFACDVLHTENPQIEIPLASVFEA